MKYLVLIFLLCPSLAWSAITHDATTTGTAISVNTITVNHTVGACTNPIAVVSVQWQRNPTGTLSTLTVGGVSATLLDSQNNYSRVELWYLTGVSVGVNAVIATFDADPKNSITMRVSSYCGVHQATPFGTSAKATGSGTAITVDVSSAAGELVIDTVQTASDPTSDTLVVGASQTERANFSQAATNHVHGASDEAGAGTTTMSWTAGTGTVWAIIGAPLKPAATTTRRAVGVMIF